MKKIVSLIMSLLLALSVSSTVFADGYNPNTETSTEITFSDSFLSETDRAFLKKMGQVFDGYTTNEKGEIIFTYSSDELRKIGFNDDEINRLEKLNQMICGTILSDEAKPSTRVSVEGGIIYFTYDDVVTLFSAAVIAGPEAVYAALVALGSVSLGPVGTAVAAVIGIIGAPTLASFCYQVTQALANQQGVYIGVETNGGFPNIVCGTW